MRRLVAGMTCSLLLVLGAAILDDDDAGGDDARRASRPAPVPATDPAPAPPVGPRPTSPSAPPTTEPTPGFVEVVDQYIAALAEARWADAYAHLCPSAAVAVSQEAFAEELAAYRRRQPLFGGYIDQQGPATDTNVVVHIEMTLGTTGSQAFVELVRSGPGAPWQICNVNGGIGEAAIWPALLDPDVRRS